MAAFRLHDGVAIVAGVKSGTQGDDEARLVDLCIDIALGHAGVDQDAHIAADDICGPLRGNQDRDAAGTGHLPSLAPGPYVFGEQFLDPHLAFKHGRGQGHAAANDQRPWQLEDYQREAGLMQTVCRAGGQIAAAA